MLLVINKNKFLEKLTNISMLITLTYIMRVSVMELVDLKFGA